MAVVRLPASDPGARIGALVLNPGGPGGSGIQFLEESWEAFPAALRARFDLVSFDPRGVGASDPVSCVTADQLRAFLAVNPAPSSPPQVATVVAAVRRFVAGCERNTSRLLLENIGTDDVARDMDRLRAALGESSLTYLGFSYGTYLGAVYASLFPHRVRAMVLDGAVDPALSVAATALAQAVGFETDLHTFFSWCDANAACHEELPGGARSDFDGLFGGLESGRTIHASLAPAVGGEQEVDYGVALSAVTDGLYSESYWPDLGQALGQARRGDASLLAGFAFSYAGIQPDGSVQNIVSANLAVSCVDRPASAGITTYQARAATFAAVAPDFGPSLAWGSLPCAYWPVRPHVAPGPIRTPGIPPVVVVGSTEDPATPYAWAQALSSQLSNAVLLTRDGAGQTAYLLSACVRQNVDTYLTTLVVPRRGTVCKS